MKRIAQEKEDAAQITMNQKQDAADKMQLLGLSKDKLTITQLKTLLARLKQHWDKDVPTKKVELQQQLVE